MIYIGIDPGKTGALAALHPDGDVVLAKMPDTERDVWEWFKAYGDLWDEKFAMIEEQKARPTKFKDPVTGEWKESVLRATCILFGNYMQLRGYLTAADVALEKVAPTRWHKAFGMTKQKGEGDYAWKKRLKEKAQELFPEVKVIVQTADALLIAEFCRRTCAKRRLDIGDVAGATEG